MDLLGSYFVRLSYETLDLRNSKDPYNLDTPCVAPAQQWPQHPLFHWPAAHFILGQGGDGGEECGEGGREICPTSCPGTK